ncbi:MAG: hypothetical protein JXA30_03390, partial [Deltaproteobacteria bacterium]|nr:hypothetical protein [Deltaproteobacteria bacterium]
KTGFRPRAGSSGTASTILAGTAGALGFTDELAADLFAPLNAYDTTNVKSRFAPFCAGSLWLSGEFLLEGQLV